MPKQPSSSVKVRAKRAIRARRGFSRFLDLPTEIRLHIYHFALVCDEPKQPNTEKLWRIAEAEELAFKKEDEQKKKWHKTRTRLGPERVLALARTCSMVYEEVIPIYYGRNAFKFKDTEHLYTFLYMVHEECLQHIREIHLEWSRWNGRASMALNLLPRCTRLRHLHITISWTRGIQGLGYSSWYIDEASKPVEYLTRLVSLTAFKRMLGKFKSLNLTFEEIGKRPYITPVDHVFPSISSHWNQEIIGRIIESVKLEIAQDAEKPRRSRIPRYCRWEEVSISDAAEVDDEKGENDNDDDGNNASNNDNGKDNRGVADADKKPLKGAKSSTTQ